MSSKNRLIAIAAVFLVMLGSNAYALDSKVMPGSACQPVQSAIATDITRFGSLFNSQGESILIDCPVVRDNTTNTSGTVTAAVRVDGDGLKVSCNLNSYNGSGDIVASDSAESTSTVPSTLFLKLFQSASGGSYGIACSLPKSGELINYTVSEPTPTDGNN